MAWVVVREESVCKMPPNILWICADQQRHDTIHNLGCASINTPTLDWLSQSGTAFTRAYAQSPICTPSRASFLTGCRPSTTHVHRNGNESVPAHLPLVTRELADAGYDCGLVGKLHLSSADGRVEPRPADGYRFFEWNHHPAPEPAWPLSADAYQRWLQEHGVVSGRGDDFARSAAGGSGRLGVPIPGVPVREHQTTWCVDRAIAFVSERRSGPWMLSVNMFDPHPPFDPPEEILAKVDPESVPMPEFADGDLETQERLAGLDFQGNGAQSPAGYDARGMVAAYYAQIELIDMQLARLIDALESTDQLRNTVIVYMSDHGEMLGDHGLIYKGCRFYEGLVRVPLIVSWPDGLAQGQVIDSLVELTDVAPTLREIAGLEQCGFAEGRSLVPTLTGSSTAPHREVVYSEYHDALDLPHHSHGTMIFDGRYKLASYHDVGLFELYDLDNDPGEHRNLWDDHHSSAIRHELLRKAVEELGKSSEMGGARLGTY